jgi:hypothetical protein
MANNTDEEETKKLIEKLKKEAKESSKNRVKVLILTESVSFIIKLNLSFYYLI